MENSSHPLPPLDVTGPLSRFLTEEPRRLSHIKLPPPSGREVLPQDSSQAGSTVSDRISVRCRDANSNIQKEIICRHFDLS